MFRCYHNITHFAPPLTSHQTDHLTRPILRLFNGSSRRQSLCLLYSSFRGRFKIDNDSHHLRKMYIYTKRDIIWPLFSKARNSDDSSRASSNRSKDPKDLGENETGKAWNDNKQQKNKPPNKLLEKAKNLFETVKASVLKTNKPPPPPPPYKQVFDLRRCSTERNFITPVRAMNEFLLKSSDLEGLRKTKRRSPFENEPPITVYWRKDVEAKAIDIYGSKENLLREILKHDIEKRRYQQNIFNMKRILRDYRRGQGRETDANQAGLSSSTGRAVIAAICINALNTLGKFYLFHISGSSSIFAEGLHSFADTFNQVVLAYGLHKSTQKADSYHPYGYTNVTYVASLISGLGLFFVFSGVSISYAINSAHSIEPVDSLYWGLIMLAMSFFMEGATFLIALNTARKDAKKVQMKVMNYVLAGIDPSITVIVLEDATAVFGVFVALCSMLLSTHLNTPIPDMVGGIVIGACLSVVAFLVIMANAGALVGRSIAKPLLENINEQLESDVMIRAIHDVKGIYIGCGLVRYKAEIDFDGRELTRLYLEKQDLNQLLKEVKDYKTIDELEAFMLNHGENIVDMMGGEIDRIELNLRKRHPEIRHCDLEIL